MNVVAVHDFLPSKGGGDYVMLNMLEAIHNGGHNLSLLTRSRSGYDEAVKFFEKNIQVTVCPVDIPRFVRHPYTVAVLARKAAKLDNCDLFLFSDDVPKCLRGRKVISYCHYLHAVRFYFNEYASLLERESFNGRITRSLHKRLFPIFFPGHKISEAWLLVANSMVTFKHTREVFGLSDDQITVLNPPVASASISALYKRSSTEKEDLVVTIGRFEESKRFDEALRALAIHKANTKLKIIGFTHDNLLLNRLLMTTKELGLQNRVEISVNASRGEIVESLLKAKAILHLSSHEPFGISVVEGMGAGCVPVVTKGFNGPWMEITQEGRYGLGVQTPTELSEALKMVTENYQSFDIKGITSRALEYDESLFRANFLSILNGFCECD